jgi:peptide/nickel transport system ATP-binding protein/oligopeptide transport system ATP-binding protein
MMARAEPILSLRGLTTSFPGEGARVSVVDGVDLEVRRGESLGIVGESGSGKTVTFLSALGLVAPPGKVTAQHILFEGRELSKASPADWRKLRGSQIALTMQDALTALNPALMVGTQIEEVLAAHTQLRPASARRRRAQEQLRLVGVPDPARRLSAYPHELSVGLRQRAMIAIALACKPKLLVADEPTTALDVTVQAQILDLMQELRRSLAMSLVLITHDLGIVAERCDRVVVMYAGEVVETGPAAEVIASPRHPYTAGLLAALPRLDRLDAALIPIPGRVLDPARRGEGCRFAERCALRSAPCARPQELREAGPDRAARCHLVTP